MSNTNRVSIGTSGSLTNIGTLSPVLMFDWIRKEITELQADSNTVIFAQALERQSDRVLQVMRSSFEDKEEDVSKIMLKWVANFTRSKNEKTQDINDFFIISRDLWKLLGKVVSWKVSRSEEKICVNSQSDECNYTNKKNLPYNSAILKSSKKPANCFGTYSENTVTQLSEDEIDDDDESLIKITRNKGLRYDSKTIKEQQDEVSSQRSASNLSNKISVANEKSSNDGVNSCEDALNSFVAQDGENSTKNKVNVADDEDRYLRPSLRVESLEDLFSSDEPGTFNELQNSIEIEPEIKREILSDNEEEESEVGDEHMEEEQQNSQNSIIVKEEIEDSEFSTNNYLHTEQINRSIIFCDPSENQESSSAASSTDPLPDIQHDNEQSAQTNSSSSRLVQLSSMSTSSTPSEHQSLNKELRESTIAVKGKVSKGLVVRNLNTDFETDGIKKQRLDSEGSQFQHEPSAVKLIPDDDTYSEFSSGTQQSKLAWHMSPALASSKGFNGETLVSSSNGKKECSSKIKKYRRADYLQKQKAKRMEMKKGRNVDFCLDRTSVHNFVIEEGNVFRRYNYGEEGKVHVPESTTFLKKPLGHIPNKGSQRHRQLTAQLHDDIRTLVSSVMLRAKHVSDQNSIVDFEIAPANRLCRISRLFVTDSMLAGIDDEVFRNMYVFRLDSNKNMSLFIERLDILHKFVVNQLSAFEFSYIFILYGYDLIYNDGQPSLDSAGSLKSWFENNLEGRELKKTKDDCVYKYTIPQFVVVTIPELGDRAEQIREYNNEVRTLVKNRHGECHQGDITDFILLDWAKFIKESYADSDAAAFKVLVRKLTEFGVLFK